MTNARIDWRKHDRNAPESTYVRLAQPGDILKFPNDSQLWQVESVTETKSLLGLWKVKFYGRSTIHKSQQDRTGGLMSDGSSPWERGEMTELDRPFQEPVPETETVDWSTMGANKIVEIPPPGIVYVLIEERGYDGSSVECVFDNEAEAESYAALRNQFTESNSISYEVHPWPIGRPGCDSTDPHFDGPVWEIRWEIQYDLETEIAPKVKQRWHSGSMRPEAGFRYPPTPSNFTVWGIVRDDVIRIAEREAAQRISAELERLRIAEQKRQEHTRFRIDSEHEFG